MAKDFMPKNKDVFNNFSEDLLDYVSSKATDWEHIYEKELSGLKKLQDDFKKAFADFRSSDSTKNKTSLKTAQANFTKALRNFIKFYLYNPLVTDADRDKMKIPNRSSVRTSRTVVLELVEFVIRVIDVGLLSVDFWVKGSESKAKPRGYDGAIIRWGILDHPPESIEELTNFSTASRRLHRLSFNKEDEGKIVYFTMTWQNARSVLGKWSPIKSARIP